MISAYLIFQLELVVVCLASWVLVRLSVPRRTALWLARAVLLVALFVPFLPSMQVSWVPSPQVWAEATADGGLRLEPVGSSTLPALEATGRVVHGTVVLWLAVLGAASLWALVCVVGLRRRLKDTTLVRRYRSLELRLGLDGPGNFAVWMPGRSVVVLDEAAFTSPVDRRMALRHELQHHRHADPPFAWVLLALRTACAWNPLIHVLAEALRQLEELAVDEALVRRGVDSRDYASCLLRAAERARPVPRLLAAGLHHPSSLKRRILMLKQPAPSHSSIALIVGSLGAALLFGVAQAADGVVASSALATEEVLSSLDQARADGVELPRSPLVAEALQKLTRTPRGQRWMRASLERQADWSALVDPALAKARLPAWLAAVPLIESGYQNLGDGVKGSSAAPGMPGKGLWMFIPETARLYGLRVDEAVDQRLDPERETAAAVALLTDLNSEFGDWGLALAGYNQGAGHVRRAIVTEGTRDLWTLVERSALNDYAPMVFAAALVLHEPELLDR